MHELLHELPQAVHGCTGVYRVHTHRSMVSRYTSDFPVPTFRRSGKLAAVAVGWSTPDTLTRQINAPTREGNVFFFVNEYDRV